VVDFVRRNAPNEYNGQPVRYFDTFMSTVSLATAFPGGGGNAGLLPLLNLEIWGVPTSRPLADPANGGFIYQRYQRSIMHYREVCRCTERILLADWFKTVFTGQGLPSDLAEDMSDSPYIYQWNPNRERWMNRPDLLPNTDLTNAFVPDLPGFATPPAATGAPGGGSDPDEDNEDDGDNRNDGDEDGPRITLQLSDDRVEIGDTLTITVIARDEDGIDWLRWEGEPRDSDDENDPALGEEREADCDEREECANVWEIQPSKPGRYVIYARARDEAGNRTEVSGEVRFRGEEPTATPTATSTAQPTATPTSTPTATTTP
jgi:hypothetical protein